MSNIGATETVKQQVEFNEALAKYHGKADDEAVTLAEQERKQVLDRFPIAGWPELPIERYALGQGEKEDRFCWWMEFGTNHIGSIAGGSAVKHMIYRQKSGEWSFDREQFKDVEEAWHAVRAGFVERFQHAQNGDWSSISEDDGLTGGQVLKTKALVCYFPDQLLPICSVAHLKHFLQLVGVDDDSLKGNNAVRFNRLLLENLQGRQEFAGWNPKQLEQFLYFWADPRDQRMVVKIAPGGNASLWNECLEGGYMRVGWGRAGDLTEFESKETFRPKFLQEYGALYNNNLSTVTKKGNELWTLRELKPGDLIVANQGTSKVLGVGEVLESGYEWTEHGNDDFNHIVHVKWVRPTRKIFHHRNHGR